MFETPETARSGAQLGLGGLAGKIAKMAAARARPPAAPEADLPPAPAALLVPLEVEMTGPAIGGTAALLVAQALDEPGERLEAGDFPPEELSVWRRRSARAAGVCKFVSVVGSTLTVHDPDAGHTATVRSGEVAGASAGTKKGANQ